MNFIASFSRSDESGIRMITQRMLNIEWHIAIPTRLADSSSIAGASTALTMQYTVIRIAEPITLNERCTKAALLAFLFAPIADKMAVIHVPIF